MWLLFQNELLTSLFASVDPMDLRLLLGHLLSQKQEGANGSTAIKM